MQRDAATDRPDADVDVEVENEQDDIDKVVDELAAAKENATGGEAAAEAACRRGRPRKVHRQSSKDGAAGAGTGGPASGPVSATSGFVHGPRSWKNSRRSRNGYGRGLPKKGGAGGKGVWGAPGSELLETYEDINDPNFDNETMSNGDIELKKIVPEVTNEEIKRKVEPIVLEYFENGDTNEAAMSISDTIPYNRRDVFVEQLIEIAMDHKPSHREMTSVLISEIFGHVINELDITKALENLLANLADLTIDIPDAATVLGNFIARAVADDCIPPKFLMTAAQKSDDAVFQAALSRAETLLSMKHGMLRLHNVWGVGGALRPVKALTRQMALLLQEYLSSGDLEEASRCLRDLEVPHFHHELVYEAVVMALEANNAAKEEALCRLLKAFDDAVLVTRDQLERGFERVFDDLPDISMDVPLAYIILDRFVDRCHKEKFVTETVLSKMPPRGRKRYVSEGDQHLFKNNRVF